MKKKSWKFTKRVITFVLTTAMVFSAMPPTAASAKTSFRWVGLSGKAKVETGLGNGTGTEGIWFVATDNADGGESQVILDQAAEDGDGTTISDADVKAHGGISGTAILKAGSLDYKPVVWINFYVAGLKDGKPEAANALDWGGLSISYECDLAPAIELSLGDEVDKQIGYAWPEYNLKKAPAGEGKVETVTWDQIKMPSWAPTTSKKVSGEEAAAQLVSVKFKIQGNPGTYHFRIAGIGSTDAKLPLPGATLDEYHTFTPVAAKAATCLTDGNIAYYKCDDCGKLFTDNTGSTEITADAVIVKATGHKWGNWTIVKAATETATGTKIRVCQNDPSHIESEEIPMLTPSGSGKGTDGQQTISDDGKKLTDTDGQEYQIADKSEPDKLKKGDQVADEKTGGKYMIASVTAKNGKTNGGEVIFQKPYDAAAATVLVEDTVTIGGVKFKVTEIAAKAFYKNKKLTRITIGKNIKKIGANAFNGASNLKNITIKTTKLKKKTVGKNAFKGIHKKAKAKVPAKKLKSYKSVLKARGMNGKKQSIKK